MIDKEKEIVQALRCCAYGTRCEKCPAINEPDCIDANDLRAAAAIDRLTAENAALREKVTQWISVEERRPEPGKRVLATDGVFVGEADRMEIQGDKLMVYSRWRLVYVADLGQIMLAKLTPTGQETKC